MTVRDEYLAVIALAERLHRRTLDVLQLELTRIKVFDLNAVQVMILLNIGTEEVTATDLTARGAYQGTNMSYSIKKLTESGYLHQTRSEQDQRLVLIRLSDKGHSLLEDLNAFYERLAAELVETTMDERELKECAHSLTLLNRFTMNQQGHYLPWKDVIVPSMTAKSREQSESGRSNRREEKTYS
jgi:DNA-binding MarR family transcriptional regulator